HPAATVVLSDVKPVVNWSWTVAHHVVSVVVLIAVSAVCVVSVIVFQPVVIVVLSVVKLEVNCNCVVAHHVVSVVVSRASEVVKCSREQRQIGCPLQLKRRPPCRPESGE